MVWFGWWVAGGELSRGVFGFPSLSFGDGPQEHDESGWDVGIIGCWSFPAVRAVLHGVDRLDAGLLKELPNKFAAFGTVIVESFVRPLPRHQHTASSDAQVLELMGFALAPPRGHGVTGALGLDAIQQPHWTPG